MIKIGIVGDFRPEWAHHVTINESLNQAADRLTVSLEANWIPTDSISDPPVELVDFDGIWCSSGSPYRSMEGALRSIRFAREQNRAFFAT